MAASRNPVLSRAGFDSHARSLTERMTLGGTVRKTFLLLAIAFGAMVYVWAGMPGLGYNQATVYPLMIVGFIGGVGLLLFTNARPETASITGPLYAVLQGLVLGVVTLMLNAKYPGLPTQAALLTVATMGVMLVGYRTGLIRATERFRTIVVSCTLSIFVFYIIAFVMGLFGLYIPFLHEGGIIGIGFSLFVTGLAAANLILDFDLIDRGVGHAPAQMEWLAAFGLVVTLIWLYFEMMRLLAKLRR